MKKHISILLCLILCLILASCGTAPAESQPDSTPMTGNATEPSQEVSTDPSEDPPDGTPVSEDTLEQLQELFGDAHGWYAKILTSDFQMPQEIDLYQMFYDGLPGSDDKVSENEKAYLESVRGSECDLDIFRIPADQIDPVLQQYLGVSLEETQKIGLDKMFYWADTDCYYTHHGDTNAITFLLHSAYAQEDGTILMYYANDIYHEKTEATPDKVAVLRPCESGYQIISNQDTANLNT